ncbi:nucleolar protein [Elasticomyces elasticus]|uniref:Nucleolar protein n=1 Tax=Exophiala sideris TaxID=1016849 RepID=A0ABR0J2H9_9EURO|nr:nucleolar protein [Elasticomyces elasticus]KAK5023950.1 nucleolar protein [Exophiala sideris]KAK5030034.1 nucleolar protein [Exophiala sideris]KAK5053529.1 nucleolar protein [Exophiala sideris]KAK5179430.1 nucleolar protein [Eurotiomycetes sp. CCFEE 6388]
MGEKKRKESSGAADMVSKKSKKSRSAEPADAIDERETILSKEPSSDNAPVTSTKKTSRKRAADFMEGDENVPAASESAAAVKKPKTKKSKKLLSADGVNGVVEHSGDQDLETATSHQPISTSMQAEAERTVEHELEDEFAGNDEEDGQDEEEDEDDNAAALLAGFDSDTEDRQEDKDLNLTTTPALDMDKKTRKKLTKLQGRDSHAESGTVYVGRIPHGFYETEMKEYFSQFGDISRLRLSRNKRTGASKHFAFIEFKSNEVAKIVASTMDNYLLFGHILKCKYAEPGSLHPDVWKGADKKFRKIPHEKLEREKLAAPKTVEQWQKKVDKEQRKRELKAEKLKSLGIDMPGSILASPADALQQRLAAEEETKQIEDAESAPTGLIEPPEGLPKDEVAIKESKKSKKDKKKKADAEPAAEAETVVDQETPAEAKPKAAAKKDKKKKAGLESTEPATQTVDDASAVDEVEVRADGKVKKEKKEKKEKKKTPTEELREAGQAAMDAAVAHVNEKIDLAEKKSRKNRASKKAAQQATEPAAEETTTADVAEPEDEPEPEQEPESETAMDTSADFISLGAAADDMPAWKKERKEKKVAKKLKKDRKNLVKARGPKSGLVSTKDKADPTATGRGGVPLLGKDKYNKAKRQEHKEKVKELQSKRGGRRA